MLGKDIAAKKLTLYTSTNDKSKSLTINKSNRIYMPYIKRKVVDIRVKNSYRRYGYVKVGKSILFIKTSCLVAR